MKNLFLTLSTMFAVVEHSTKIVFVHTFDSTITVSDLFLGPRSFTRGRQTTSENDFIGFRHRWFPIHLVLVPPCSSPTSYHKVNRDTYSTLVAQSDCSRYACQ